MDLSVYFVTPDDPADDLVLAASKGGATVIQYRDKSAPDEQMIRRARHWLPGLKSTGVTLFINDRLAVARALGPEVGLHIGQTDGSPEEARELLGPDAPLGLSIENQAQLDAIPADTVSYLGIGPVRATSTKPDHAPPIGFDGLAAIVGKAGLPCVAIGGLTADDIPAVRQAGCDGIAVVSAIAGAPDPEAATRSIATAWLHT